MEFGLYVPGPGPAFCGGGIRGLAFEEGIAAGIWAGTQGSEAWSDHSGGDRVDQVLEGIRVKRMQCARKLLVASRWRVSRGYDLPRVDSAGSLGRCAGWHV